MQSNMNNLQQSQFNFIINYVSKVSRQLCSTSAVVWGRRGSPWEFNLRDLFRWCDLLLANQVRVEFSTGMYVSKAGVTKIVLADDRRV